MEQLAEECELECAEEKQIQVFEKCLPLLRPDRDARTKSGGWLLMAKFLERCGSQCLRAAQSRLAKKLVDVKNEPTLYSGVFLRQLLIRNPQIGNLHAEIVHSIILSFIDMTVSTGDSLLRKLCIELYSIRYGCDVQMSERLLVTLSAAINNRLLSDAERMSVLNLKSLGISSYRVELCRLLFDLYSSALCFAKPGQYALRDAVMNVLDEGINNPYLRGAALNALCSICSNGGSAVLPLIHRIILLLISKLESPSSDLYDAIAHLCRIYGTGTALYRYFFVVFESMKHPLDDQVRFHILDYGVAAGRLLSAILDTSAFLIKPEVLLSVQRKICEEALNNPSSSIYCGVLASFLSSCHELVPVPVQIARTVMSRCVDGTCQSALRALCDVITRPCTQSLLHSELIRRATSHINRKSTIADLVVIEDNLPSTVPNSDDPEEFAKETSAFVETPQEKTEDDKISTETLSTTNSSSVDVRSSGSTEERGQPSLEPEVREEMREKVIRASAEAVNTRDAPELPDVPECSDEPKAKRVKLVKKQKAAAPTNKPIPGEASVEEILSTFCPD
ncbi:hypothetical protein Q1695_009399 [Nippostrongylus brasiliensis]|nr:hypothetical protein Q1695_009399 [Nippostrongylus brasiliensis]